VAPPRKHSIYESWETFKNSPEVERAYTSAYRAFYALLFRVSPDLVAKHRYWKKFRKPLPLDDPKTFDEKLMWLMLNWHHPLKTQCADKFGMRSYLEDQGYGHLLVELLGTYTKASDIDFTALPKQFVLKCTHGCGFNLFSRDRQTFDATKARHQLDRWMKMNYAAVNGEIHYGEIQPRILAERYLEDGSGGAPVDYKVHCFQGKVHFTTVCRGRGPDGHGATYDDFDREWKAQVATSTASVQPERWCPPPECYPQILEAAEALSKPFPYVRIDFYALGDKALVGEMTFTPAGCLDPGLTEEAQNHWGSLIHLPAPIPSGGG